jgi:hypothetical protein
MAESNAYTLNIDAMNGLADRLYSSGVSRLFDDSPSVQADLCFPKSIAWQPLPATSSARCATFESAWRAEPRPLIANQASPRH